MVDGGHERELLLVAVGLKGCFIVFLYNIGF